MIGNLIDGEYLVEDLIGQGGFGEVYQCRENTLQRTVAVKMLKACNSTSEQRELQKLVGEARTLATLNHPNVVQIHRLGSFEGRPYIVMEFLPGRTLRDVIRDGRPPLREGLRIMLQVASGLAAIHEKGIVHRDLSSNNVKEATPGVFKILDLGLSREMSNLSTVSVESFLTGTLPYIAPEHIEGRKPGFPSDVFSFGVLLYEVLTGTTPFEAEHYMQAMYNIAHKEPAPLENYIANPPPDLEHLVSRCLEKRPEDRPGTAKDIVAELERILANPTIDEATQIKDGGTMARVCVTLRNPYTNRVMIKRREDFFGREQEIRRIYARLNANPPGSVSVVGDRKIGKSSLLNYIYMRRNRESYLEQPEKIIMVFLDLQAQRTMTLASFVQMLLGMAGYELRGRLELADCAPTLDGIKDLVQRLEQAGIRLAILLDEFEIITGNGNFDLEFFSFLRYLANHFNVAYITSSARDLQVLCHTKEISDSPFFNIFSTLRVTAFKPDEALELVCGPSERVGKPLAAYAGDLVKLAGRFPFFLQIACCHAVEYLDEHPGAAHLDLVEVRRFFYEEAKLHYRYIWEGFGPHEREVIRRTAEGKGAPDSLVHVLEELSRRHYVVREGGRNMLFSSTFEEFVLGESRTGKKVTFIRKLLGGA